MKDGEWINYQSGLRPDVYFCRRLSPYGCAGIEVLDQFAGEAG
jgi:hypothetical protein